MRFYKAPCPECKTETLFLEKLVDPTDDHCVEMEGICQVCKTKFELR